MKTLRPPLPIFLTVLAAALVSYHGFYLFHRELRTTEAFKTFFADWGYVVRYWSGQTPGLVMASVDHGKLQLFHRGDLNFQRELSGAEMAQQLAQAMEPALKELRAHGVSVWPVVIPTKLSIYRSCLHRPIPVDPFRVEDCEAPELSHKILSDAMPNQLVDLYGPYLRYAAQNPQHLLFPPLDYHWTSVGSALAAEAVARRLWEEKKISSPPKWKVAGTAVFLPSYLTDQYPLPHWFVEQRAEFQGQETLAQLEENSPQPGRLILAGTSFSNSDSAFGFARQLQSAAGRPLIRFSKSNNGYAGAFGMMKEAGFKFRRGDILVWELPLCCLNLGTAMAGLRFEGGGGN